MKNLMGEKRGLMDYGHPRSRDYGLPNFICAQLTCITNQSGKCISPARCEIGEDGKCIGFITRGKKSE